MALINKANILVGISAVKVDGEDMGLTEGGVSIEFSPTYYEHKGDQTMDAVDLTRTDCSLRVTTQFAEATFDKIKLVWDLQTAIEEDAETRTIKLGQNPNTTEHTLEFIGKSPEGYSRTYTLYRAVSFGASSHALTKGDKVVIPCEFRILPDLTKPSGEEYGMIVDRKVAE